MSSVLCFLSLLVASAWSQIILNHGNFLLATRLDPIINPGKVSGHVHAIVGGSNFGSVYDPSLSDSSQCTTANEAALDKSNYWTPALYFAWNDGTFSHVPHSGAATYYLNRPDGDDMVAFPPGFSMVGGNPNRRSHDPNIVADQATTFHCLSDPPKQSNSIMGENFPCNAPVRVQINMPQCWDGVRATSSDNSHVSYATSVDGGQCPSTHPKHLISLFYEFDYQPTPQMVSPTNGQFVLANGDPTGYGMHGDFTNGWDQDLLESMVATCFGTEIQRAHPNNGYTDCTVLHASQHSSGTCVGQGQKVDEDIGDTSRLNALPGCNPIWDGTGTKPTCPASPSGTIVDIKTGQTVDTTNTDTGADSDSPNVKDAVDNASLPAATITSSATSVAARTGFKTITTLITTVVPDI